MSEQTEPKWRTLTREEMKAIHPSHTGSPTESMRLHEALATGRAELVNGSIVEKT